MAQVTIATGPDVAYYTDQTGAGYYLLDSEPPGIWCGKAAPGLGLEGQVDAETMKNLYHYNIAPDGSLLGLSQKDPRYQGRKLWEKIEQAIQERIDDLGELATPAKIRHIKLSERAKARRKNPFYDMTFSSEKSVSLAWAAARATALRALEEKAEQDEAAGPGRSEQDEADPGGLKARAARYEQLARSVEAATMAGADAMLAYVEDRGGAMVRTGHHGKNSGEWRDAAGFVAAKFLQHTSRSNDPQLHVQIPILNKAQRLDGADEKWRSLDGRQLWALRLGAAAHAGVAEAQHLARLGIPLLKRPDGNGFEVGGVRQETIDAFSRRTAAIEKEIAKRVREYEEEWGAIDRASLYRLRKRVTVATRSAKQRPDKSKRKRSKAEAQDAAKKLESWIDRAEAESTQALTELWDAIWDYAAEHPEAAPSSLPNKSERDEIIRAAIAEVQRQNASWSRAQLEWELYRQLPVLPAGEDWADYLDGLADDALGNHVADSTVLQIGHVPDIVDVEPLGLRHDGSSILRRPNEERYCTAEHLDREEWILAEARKPVPQLVTQEAAEEAVAGTDLDLDQQRAAKGLLTSTTLVSSLVAPAGSGKTHVMAPVSRTWMAQTGCRTIGLTLSQNAARVLAGEGFGECWNIARFFARKVPVYRGDLLVIDEASQVSTKDLAKIMSMAKNAGARVILAGDPEQLGPVEAGGMAGLLAKESTAYELGEIHRFRETWEADASVKLRAGDMAAWEEYGSRGLVHHGPADRMLDDAADSWVTDYHRGRDALLLAATNEQAAELSALVRQRRIEAGDVASAAEITLSDGNEAGTGDYVRARLNSQIEISDGRKLENRDTIRIEGWLNLNNGEREAVAVLRDRDAEGGWSERFTIPESYLRENGELDYSGNVHVAQGKTVDIVSLVVGEGTSRRVLYVGMTRGRVGNRAFVATGPADPADWTREQRLEWRRQALLDAIELQKAGDIQAATARLAEEMPEPEGMRERLPWEAVIAAAMDRDDLSPTAIETMRQAQETPRNARHLLDVAEAYWWKDIVPGIDELVRQRIPAEDYQRYVTDPARPALLQELRRHEIGGREIDEILDAITGRPLDGLRSIAAGLHGRLEKEQPQPETGRTHSWGERIPRDWRPGRDFPTRVQEGYQALNARQLELGEQLAEEPPRWALEAWGMPAAEGALREDWIQKAGRVQIYREVAGVEDPDVAIGPAPARQANISEAFADAVHALALPDDTALLRAMGRGDLEARVREYARAEAAAPADVRQEMDANLAAVEHAERQAEAARLAGDPDLAQSAEALHSEVMAERARLRIADSARAEWEESVAPQAEAAERAAAELRHRRTPRPEAAETTQEERQAEHVDPEMYAERKATQAAQVEADRRARREAGFRQWTEIDPNLAAEVYPDLARAEAEREPTAAERIDQSLEAIRSAHQAVDHAQSQLEIQAELEEDRRRQLQPGPEVEAEAQVEAGRYHRPPVMQPPPSARIERDGPEPSL